MKKISLLLLFLSLLSISRAQFVARVEIKDSDTLTGVCDRKNVYTMFPMFKGQEEAVCASSNKEIEKRLNEEVVYLKSNNVKEDKGMVNIIISCKGDVVRCETDNKTKSEELDRQILAVFQTLKDWKPGKLNNKKVDSMIIYSFDIKNGKIELH